MQHSFFAESDSIRLAPMTEGDSELYRVLRNREDNRRYFFSGISITEEQQKAWYQKYLSDETQYMFSIIDKETGSFVGGIGVYDIDNRTKSAEVGRIIVDREKAGGRGYGAVAISLAVRFAMEEIALKSLYANIYSDNIPSLKSFYGAGFKRESEENNIIKVSMSMVRERCDI